MVHVYIDCPTTLKIGLSIALEATSQILTPQSVESLKRLSKQIPNDSNNFSVEITRYTALNFNECIKNFKHTMTYRGLKEDIREALVNLENQTTRNFAIA